MTVRGDRFTIKTKQIEAYSDFTTNFALNPVTGFLARVTNEDAVKQSIKTLLLTQRGERFYNAACGSRLYSLLFEPMDSVTETSLKEEVVTTIKNNEPRVGNIDCTVVANQDADLYNISISYSILNIPTQVFTLNLTLSRVR